MNLKEKIEFDMREALRSGEKLKLSALRLLLSEIKNAEIAKRKTASDDEVIEVVSRELRRRDESIQEFEKAGREDLVAKEKSEAKVLKSYLPPQLSLEEVEEIIRTAINDTGASNLKEMGKVMSSVMPQIKGRADGKMASEMVKKMLSSS